MPDGLVTRLLAGFYDVSSAHGVRRCRARGVFRKKDIHVFVGDRVTYDEVGSHEGIITHVHQRTTQLVRPPVANIEQALLVFSIIAPPFNHHLLDAALVSVARAGMTPIIVITKCDLVSEAELRDTVAPYRAAGYPCIPMSVVTGDGVADVRVAIRGHVSVFVGPSGTGKSSLGNELSSELGLKMGQVSEKQGRGKHTTRHVELFEVEPETYVVDAPGFSQLELDVESAQLWRYFPEFIAPSQDCPYRGCRHVEEADCGVKSALESGHIWPSRYDSYKSLYLEIRHREETRY